MQKRLTYLYLVTACLILLTIGFVASVDLRGVWPTFGTFLAKREPPVAILFGGDVMLARYVEETAETKGIDAIFENLTPLFNSYDYVLANFEAPVPKDHQETPRGSLRFSVKEELVTALGGVGITHLGLANNHTFDHGESGLINTREVITRAGMTPFGDPREVTSEQVAFIPYGKEGLRRLALVPIHATVAIDVHEAAKTLREAEQRSDTQVVFIHWGEEYRPEASDAQRELAHALIDNGADLIVGHHPHVMESIEEYEGTYIVYSLGNLIFDQYFDSEVETGLLLGVEIDSRDMRFTLYPIRSERSIPRLLDGAEYEEVLGLLAERSDPSLRNAIVQGTLRIEEGSERLAYKKQE